MYLTDQSVGRVVRQLRELRRITQKELAARAHVDQGYVSQVEAGKKQPSLDVLTRLLTGLDAVLIVEVKEDTD